jgi:hypothetical protein
MISKRELLEEKEFLNTLLKNTADYNTQRDIFGRLAENHKAFKRLKINVF